MNTWFSELQKPSFNPPNQVFGPVWTTLHILMGVAGYLAWSASPPKSTMLVFWAQLGLNLAWSLIFFGMRRPDLAFFEILLLWVVIALTIISFFKANKVAAYLLLPYWAWVSFASVLNFAIWQLNR